MAILLDATSSSANQTGSSVTFAHTCTGSYRCLVVGVTIADNADTVSGITYGGVAMTKIDAIDTPNTSRRAELWILTNPSSGANNIIVTLTGTPTNFFNVGAVSYTGVMALGQPDASGKYSDDTANDLLKAITTVADNCWLVGVACNGNALNPTADSGTTIRLSVYNRAGNGYELFFLDSNAPKTPAGSYALGVTGTTSNGGAIVVASLLPILSYSGSDTTGTTSDTFTSTVTKTISVSDISVVSDSKSAKAGFSTQAKNTPIWTNQQKN